MYISKFISYTVVPNAVVPSVEWNPTQADNFLFEAVDGADGEDGAGDGGGGWGVDVDWEGAYGEEEEEEEEDFVDLDEL